MHFLYQHFSENTGAILGDDMGLGKTVQVRVNLSGKGFDNYSTHCSMRWMFAL